MSGLEIWDLRAEVGGRPVLCGVTLAVPPGERHAVIGAAGAGKSVFAHALAGRPDVAVTGGKVRLDGVSLVGLSPHERARRGLFLAFERPAELPGITHAALLRAAASAVRDEPVGAFEFQAEVRCALASLGLEAGFLKRALDDCATLAERRRAEVLQLAILRPRAAVLDSFDDGLDDAALEALARAVHKSLREDAALLVLSRTERAAAAFGAGALHRLEAGRIVKTEGART
jgi:Fe-S cluster assembly ATP-binding protein